MDYIYTEDQSNQPHYRHPLKKSQMLSGKATIGSIEVTGYKMMSENP